MSSARACQMPAACLRRRTASASSAAGGVGVRARMREGGTGVRSLRVML